MSKTRQGIIFGAVVLVATFIFWSGKVVGQREWAQRACQRYYHLPCNEMGELREDLTETQINTWYEQDMRGQIELRQDEVDYLIGLRNKLKK